MSTNSTLTTSHGVVMPRILYGTAWKKHNTARLVEQALEQGFRGIDTACQPKHYAEDGVGEGLQAAYQRGLVGREQLYLQTKFTPLDGQDPLRVPYDVRAPLAQQIQQSARVSLQNLQTDYLDSLVLHSPLADFELSLQAWWAMEALVEQGITRQLGISNCYRLDWLQQLYQQATVKPAVLQNRFYTDTDYDKDIRVFCQQNGVVYQSFWTLTANPYWLVHDAVTELAGRYGCTPQQVVFRLLTQIGIVPLSGTCSIPHMQEDVAIFEFELSDEECELLTGALGI